MLLRSHLPVVVGVAAAALTITGCTSNGGMSDRAPGSGGAAGGAAALAAAQPAGAPMLDGVTVTGVGRVTGRPDVVRATVGVQVERPQVQPAIEEANRRAEAVIAALREAGIAQEDIQTSQLNVDPRHADGGPGRPPEVRGYVATHLLDVRIEELDRAGEVLQAAVDAAGDAAALRGVSFLLEDNAELLGAAREQAFEDARAKAEHYARLAGRPLGDLIAVQEAVGGQPPPQPVPYGYGGATDMARAGSLAIEPGEQEVAVHVTAVWSIG